MSERKSVNAGQTLPAPAGSASALCTAIVREAVEKGYADLFDESWNPDAHVEITLTIAELRIAADALQWQPSTQQLSASAKARAWREYIEELDGVE